MAKKPISLIVGIGGPAPKESKDAEEMGSLKKHGEDTVKEFFECCKAGDWKGAWKAFHALDELCEDEGEAAEEEA